MSVTLAVGTRLPAFHTSLGRVQLGFLDDGELWCRLRSLRIEAYTPSTITDVQALYERVREDRAQGFSIVDEELERGLRSIAVPIVDRAGEAIAGLNISTHSTRTTRNEMRDRFLPRLRAVARASVRFARLTRSGLLASASEVRGRGRWTACATHQNVKLT